MKKILAAFIIFTSTLSYADESCVNSLVGNFINQNIDINKKSVKYYNCAPEAVQLFKEYSSAENPYQKEIKSKLLAEMAKGRETSIKEEIINVCRSLDREVQNNGLQNSSIDDIQIKLRLCNVDGWPYLHSLVLDNAIKGAFLKNSLTKCEDNNSISNLGRSAKDITHMIKEKKSSGPTGAKAGKQ